MLCFQQSCTNFGVSFTLNTCIKCKKTIFIFIWDSFFWCFWWHFPRQVSNVYLPQALMWGLIQYVAKLSEKKWFQKEACEEPYLVPSSRVLCGGKFAWELSHIQNYDWGFHKELKGFLYGDLDFFFKTVHFGYAPCSAPQTWFWGCSTWWVSNPQSARLDWAASGCLRPLYVNPNKKWTVGWSESAILSPELNKIRLYFPIALSMRTPIHGQCNTGFKMVCFIKKNKCFPCSDESAYYCTTK